MKLRATRPPPGLGLWLALALTLILLAITAQAATAQLSDGMKAYTLARGKDVLFDKEKKLSAGTAFDIKMRVSSSGNGALVDVFLMTKANYDRYKAGELWSYDVTGSALNVAEFNEKFEVPEKEHWVWVIDNTDQPSGGAYSGENLVVYAKVDLENTNILAYLALLFGISLAIIILLSVIVNSLQKPKTKPKPMVEETPITPIHTTELREHRDVELPGYGSRTEYYEDIAEGEALEPGADGGGGVTTTRTVKRTTTRRAIGTAPTMTVPDNINPAAKPVPSYIKRRELRGEGLGGVGTAAPQAGRPRTQLTKEEAGEDEELAEVENPEFTHCSKCLAVVPSESPYCYRCKASLQAAAV